MAKIKTDRRVYELLDGSLSVEVPGGQRARLFAGIGKILDGADADRYRAFIAPLEAAPEPEADESPAVEEETPAAEADDAPEADDAGGEESEEAVPAVDGGHPIEPIVARGARRRGRRSG